MGKTTGMRRLTSRTSAYLQAAPAAGRGNGTTGVESIWMEARGRTARRASRPDARALLYPTTWVKATAGAGLAALAGVGDAGAPDGEPAAEMTYSG